MKKKLLSAVLSVAMIATVLAGCGGSGASTSRTGAAGESTAAAAAEEGVPGGLPSHIHRWCEDYGTEYQE